MMNQNEETIPYPPTEELVEENLKEWGNYYYQNGIRKKCSKYKDQEEALTSVFTKHASPDLPDVLAKVSILNDFYSTQIFDTYSVAKHISVIDGISNLIANGDLNLIRKISEITLGEKTKNFYSFATKYCHHHNQESYPIYDSYVGKVLKHCRKMNKGFNFRNSDLENYSKFKDILTNFRNEYGLEKFSLREIDLFLWQTGKRFFPKKYY